jgi:phosphate-selective porin OprO/OprP
MEVASPVSAFAPGLRLGVELDGEAHDPSLTWSLNVSSVGQSQQFSDASSSALRGAGRIAWRPLGVEPQGTGALLHLAASGSYTFSGSGEIRYRSRPESDLMPRLVDTDEISGDAGMFGLEGAWRDGPLTLQGEFLRSRVSRDGDSSVTFRGAYVQVAYMVTGETRRYDTETAVFTGIEPARPFERSLASLGALEIAARYSWLDLEDEDVAGGVMRSLNLGLVWTLNYWIKAEAGYVAARTRGNANEGTSRVLQARLALRF